MGKVASGVKCSVSGCEERAERSTSQGKAKVAGLNVSDGRRAYLCKNHYKQLKKATKKESLLEKWRYTA